MVQSRKRGKKSRELLGSHQRSWVWGRHVVVEILEAGRWPVHELHLDEALPAADAARARALAAKQGAEAIVESAQRLEQLCHTAEHQGYLAKMGPFPYADTAELTAIARSGGEGARPPLFAVLDAIQDPFNFGAIVRTAEVLGVDAIFIGEQRQVGVTSMVARSSSGAVNRIPIARVADLVQLVRELRESGIQVLAASEKDGVDCRACDYSVPTALVLGNEGQGIRPELIEACGAMVRIPQYGAIGSLNVATAAAILFYEARRGTRHAE